eukprot:5619102-Pyramimonas_sp.AAC.2
MDVKGDNMDVKGNNMDVKGNNMEVKGNNMDVKAAPGRREGLRRLAPPGLRAQAWAPYQAAPEPPPAPPRASGFATCRRTNRSADPHRRRIPAPQWMLRGPHPRRIPAPAAGPAPPW